MMQDIKGKVLIVDDEENIRLLIQDVMQDAGHDVVTASNGKEALAIVEQSDIGVMLLDINMPEMSGIEVLHQLTEHWPHICVIMITAVYDINTAVDAMKMGAFDYITKPFKRNDLLEKLQNAIEQRDLIAKQQTICDIENQIWSTGLKPEDWLEK